MAWVNFVREGKRIEVEDGVSVLEAEIRAGLSAGCALWRTGQMWKVPGEN